jgi:hypothetical protein
LAVNPATEPLKPIVAQEMGFTLHSDSTSFGSAGDFSVSGI